MARIDLAAGVAVCFIRERWESLCEDCRERPVEGSMIFGDSNG